MSYRRLLLTAAATSLALAACDKNNAAGPVTGAPIASLPLAQTAPPAETVAPAADALPTAPPIRVAMASTPSAYDYVDDAYALSDAFADSPPDYAVDYDGEQPWVWRSSGGEYRVVEDAPDGEREYFYRDDSGYPFLIRDSHYCYAYDDSGDLVEVYDSSGRPYPNYAAQAAIAASYLFRGRHLYDAAVHDQRQSAYASDWRARREQVLAPQQRWAAEQQRNPDWRRIHDQRAQQPPPRLAALQQERGQRQAYASRVAPVIAAAPTAPPHPGAPPEGRAGFPGDRGVSNAQRADAQRAQPADAAAQGRQQQQAQAAAVHTQAEAQQQQQARANANTRDQQRAQAATAQQQQRQQQDQARAVAQTQAHDQKAQAEAANHARQDAGRQTQAGAQQQQQAAAQQQQHRAQEAQAANQAQQEANHQAQMAQQHQQQAQVAAQQHQADAAGQHAQMAAQHAQAAQVQQHAAQQHAQAAAQPRHPPPPKPEDKK